MNKRIVRIVLPALLSVVSEQPFTLEDCFAITYLSIEQAQASLSPDISWERLHVSLSEEQKEAIEDSSGVSIINPELRIWRSSSDDLFIVDDVLGKHEYISYAVIINSTGSIKGLEILEYRESYGEEIRRPEWRTQFAGKTFKDKVELEEDILNISGATISCSHVTRGIKRLLATHELVLKGLLLK